MTELALGEFHQFEAAGRQFIYLVPSAAVFALDDPSDAIIQALGARSMTRHEVIASLSERFGREAVGESLAELEAVQAIGEAGPQPLARHPSELAGPHPRSPLLLDSQTHSSQQPQALPQPPVRSPRPKFIPLTPFPLSTLVVNVTNKCNLSCAYCYEYGEDRIPTATSPSQPRLMSEDTARESVEFLLRTTGSNQVARLTFFGGETLLNFSVIRKTIPYARRRAAELGKRIEFSLTTNATLLNPETIEFLAENEVGVTVSIDGPRELQNRFRVFHDGSGSYDVIRPKIRELLKRHRSRPIGARVTLTSEVQDVTRIFRHLTEDIGFWEVGFAPVTTSAGRDYALGEGGLDAVLQQFRTLAEEFLVRAVENRHHGFTNVRDTLEEIHKGLAKAYPCGAGLGLLGVATDGTVSLCHRFAGSPDHSLGSVRDGIDHGLQARFLERHHVDNKTECQTCWARPLCSGGCYHEAYVRYGSTARPNLHYCEWIRGWTDTCLRIYGELAERNPLFLKRFDEQVNDEALAVG